MLNIEALQAAMPLVVALDERRFFLMPVEGSPLAELVKANRTDMNCSVPDGNGGWNPSLDDIAFLANARDNELGFSPHDIVEADVVDRSATAVRNHLLFAKSIVGPIVTELAENTAKSIAARMETSKLLAMNVVVAQPSPLLSNKSFISEAKQFENQPFVDINRDFNLPTYSYDELVELLNTGKGGIDSDVKAWLAIKGEQWLLNVWTDHFQIKEGSPTGQLAQFLRNDVDLAIAIFLISRKMLAGQPPEGVTMSLGEYRDRMADFRDQAALRVNRAIFAYDSDIKNGRMVLDITDRTTTVHPEMYKEWIESGKGSNEILFGNSLSSTPVYTVDALNSSAVQCAEEWNRHERMVRLSDSNMRYTKSLDALRAEFQKQLLTIAEGEESTIAHLTTVNGLFEEQLKLININDFECLYDTCMKLVCRSRFYTTASEFILGSYNRIAAENPNANPREVGAMVAAEYVADWTVSQVRIVKG